MATAPFPGAYNFPVHVARDGRFIALHPQGTWTSADGATWDRVPLPYPGTSHSYLPYLQHQGATWILGHVTGDYLGFSVDPLVRRTADYRSWQLLGRSNLPKLIFPTIASFHGALWLIGGFDGRGYSREIWRSVDALSWQKVGEVPWLPGARGRSAVYRGRLWVIGSGTIDGPARSEVWSSPDGLNWSLEADKLADPQPFGYAAQVFQDRIWLLGANRSGGFGSGILVSNDGRRWASANAPWSPRGGPATWVANGRLYLTGGKFSYPVNGQPHFVYSNDVWAMAA